ncbi:MAG: hypothetical protein QQN50_07355 [Nitrosopumilus sp.]
MSKSLLNTSILTSAEVPAVTVCAAHSTFIQCTVSPALIVIFAGE